MSPPIHSLLADELDISDERARKLLRAMLREIRKRALQKGVRLPNLGTFQEEGGELTFEASPSLARSVNRQYEGLSKEDLSSPAETTPEEEDSEDPFSEPSSGEEFPAPASETDPGEEEFPPDRPETEVEGGDASSAELADESEDLQGAGSPKEESREGSESTSQPSSDEVEELYPLVKEVSGTEAEEEPDAPSPSSEDLEPQPAPPSEGPTSAPEAPPDDSNEEGASPPDSSRSSERAAPSSDRKPTPPSGESASLYKIFVGTFFLLFLGGAGWYVLGQQGTVPPPQATIAGITTQIQDYVGGADSRPDRRSAERAQEATASSQSQTSEEEPAPSSDSPADREAAGSVSESASSEEAPAQGIDSAAGGWTIVVASRTDRESAESLRDTFRERFAAASLPVDIVTGETNNTTRYRIVLGQYESRDDIRQALDKHADELPEGAWPLRLR